MSETSELIMPLKGRGDKILQQNLSENEEVFVKLQGSNGQALVLTDKRLFIVKWGWLAGSTFGGKCIGYEYRNITALEAHKHLVTHVVQVLTPATQHQKLSNYGGRDKGTNVTESDFAISYSDKKLVPLFQQAVNLGRELISKAHESGASKSSGDDIDKLERLAKLKEQGVITEQEFAAKKKQILGL